MANHVNLQDFLADYDSDKAADDLARAEGERQAFVGRFPLEAWRTLSVEQYAQGHPGGPDSFVTSLQTKTKSIAAVFLGDAINGLIYFSKKRDEWVSFWEDLSPKETWERARAAWLLAFDFAKTGNWTEIDTIEDLAPAKVLVLKALYIYFPEDILPTNSENHARKFLKALGAEVEPHLHFVSLNRHVLDVARNVPEFDDWTTYQINRFLYQWIDPGGKRSYKQTARPIQQRTEERSIPNRLFSEIQTGLEWRNQVILYGPPGTGKTYRPTHGRGDR